MMDGLYLYCVRDKTVGDNIFSIKGIDGNGEVFIISYNEFEAVVSGRSLTGIRIRGNSD